MQVSFLKLMADDEQHLELGVMYGGNLFSMHSCVSAVHPPNKISELRNRV